ncbi:MAG: formate dehydrogenase subunit alpha [Pseudomonadota bacterium]
MFRVTIDGQPFEIPQGGSILDALRTVGHDVPHPCHDDRLRPAGACRLCIVAVDNGQRPVTACNTPLADGMCILTRTPELQTLRQTNEALMKEPVLATALFTDDTHPYLGVDMQQCIHCTRCVRICEEVQGQFVWHVWGRGEQSRIATTAGGPLPDSGCTSCGACVDTCPTGALFDKRSTTPARTWTRSTCSYCAVGCQLDVGVANGRVVAIRPAMSPVNRGHLCSKGRYAFDFNHSADRVTTPMLRDGSGWRAASWDEALDFTATRLRELLDRHGPDALGVLGSARATNEENYLAQKFARQVIGTHNVDCCARVCHAPSARALKTMLGTGAATNSFDDIELARTFLLCGCNPTENHPVVGARIKQAVLAGARLVVIDPRRTELAALADIHLAVRPGHNIPLLNALAATILEENLVDQAFLDARVDGLEAFRHFIRDFAPEQVAAACGVDAGSIRAAARLYAAGNPSMCLHGLGVTEHTQGSEGVMALINLALLTGNLGRPGAGINPLRGQNNVQGSAHMGCMPNGLPGAAPLNDENRERFERLWGAPLPRTRGLNLMAMLDAAADGRLKGLWCIGYDIFLTLPDAQRTAEALRRLELVIVQDLFLNETARAYGTVFFPAASAFEKDGTFMNSDRRVQRIRQAVAPPGEARPDWWIIQQLAQRLGHRRGFDFAGAEEIWNEVRAAWPAGAGLGYARLERESLHWPCPDEQHPGTPVLHVDHFAGRLRATLAPIPFIPSPERCDDEFPFLLITGRRIHHFNAGTMSLRTPNAVLQPVEALDMAAPDAQRLAVAEGDQVQVHSRYGSLVLPVHISTRMKPGELFVAFHQPALFVNRLTSPHRDRLEDTPEYKRVAVRLERATGQALQDGAGP